MRLFDRTGRRAWNQAASLGIIFAVTCALAASQTTRDAATQAPAAQNSTSAPLTLTLADALERARSNSPEFRAAGNESGLAHEDRIQGGAGLLPTVNYNNQFVYTEGNGTASGKFIANNGVHEYISWGTVHQNISLGMVADYKRAAAAEALAKARLEIASRGLEVTVVDSYYGLLVAQRKYATGQHAVDEAQRFLDIS